jgi:hypothetical protein
MMMPQEGKKKKFAQRLACAEVYFSSCATTNTNDPKGTVELLRKMHVTMMQSPRC